MAPLLTLEAAGLPGLLDLEPAGEEEPNPFGLLPSTLAAAREWYETRETALGVQERPREG